MKYVAAYMLAAMANSAPSEADVKKVIDAIGADIDDTKLSKVMAELKGKNVDDVVAEGMGLLASVPSSGGAAAGGAAGGDAGAAEEAPKEEEKKEESESE